MALVILIIVLVSVSLSVDIVVFVQLMLPADAVPTTPSWLRCTVEVPSYLDTRCAGPFPPGCAWEFAGSPAAL